MIKSTPIETANYLRKRMYDLMPKSSEEVYREAAALRCAKTVVDEMLVLLLLIDEKSPATQHYYEVKRLLK